MHQYTGAYLARHSFGIEDEEGARRHPLSHERKGGDDGARGCSSTSPIFWKRGREFAGIDVLRALFWGDLKMCLYRSLKDQLAYLAGTDKPVYPLTEQAYRWIKQEIKGERIVLCQT